MKLMKKIGLCLIPLVVIGVAVATNWHAYEIGSISSLKW
jgi:hypothetical protein